MHPETLFSLLMTIKENRFLLHIKSKKISDA